MLKTVGNPNTRYGDQTILDGNLVIGTAGKGVDFSSNANAAGMTSELLDWYEEGTWTPGQGAGLTVVGSFTSEGTYTRIGRQVTVRGKITGSTSVACASANPMVTGLPFSVLQDAIGVYSNDTLTDGGQVFAFATALFAVGAVAATGNIFFTATYFV